MIKLIVLAILAIAAFNAGADPATTGAPAPPTTTAEPAHENPGFQPGWGCDHPGDTTGVKGRVLAVPVDPADNC